MARIRGRNKGWRARAAELSRAHCRGGAGACDLTRNGGP